MKDLTVKLKNSLGLFLKPTEPFILASPCFEEGGTGSWMPMDLLHKPQSDRAVGVFSLESFPEWQVT